MSRSFFLPSGGRSGVSVSILPKRLTVTGQLVYAFSLSKGSQFSSDDLIDALQGNGSEIVVHRSSDMGMLMVARPGILDVRAVFQLLDAGLEELHEPGHTLIEGSGSFVDSLKTRWRTVQQQSGISEAKLRPNLIGKNRYGWLVSETIAGRVAEVGDDSGTIHGEFQRTDRGEFKRASGPVFLRAHDKRDLSAVARAVALMIVQGSQFNKTDIERFHAVATESSWGSGLSLYDFYEHIESQLASYAHAAVKRGQDSRYVGRVLTERSAAHSERTGQRMLLQQYSTPLSLGGIASHVIGDVSGSTILEPCVGNGSLVAMLNAKDAEVTGIELDPERLARSKQLLGDGFEAICGDALSEMEKLTDNYDVLLANPPFEKIDEEFDVDQFGRKVRISRLEHKIVFHALKKLKDDGAAFIVLPGNMMNGGDIKGAVRQYDNWLSATYNIAGKAVLDGRLYSKAGAQFPVILYALSGILEVPKPAPTKDQESSLPYIKTMDELIAWSETTRDQMKTVVRIASAEPILNNEEKQSHEAIDIPVPSLARDVMAEAIKGIEDDLIDDNDLFQVRYRPSSRLGVARTKIQKALSGPTAKALLDVEHKQGNIDKYVAGELNYDLDELENVLSPEQIDAVGLALNAFSENKGILIGDLMGVGKGRSLSALMMMALKQNRPVMFVTKKPELFQDLLARDFCDVSGLDVSQLKNVLKPFVLNTVKEASIIDTDTGKAVFKHDAELANSLKSGGALSADINLVLGTYSQFGAGGFGWKSRAVKDWMVSADNPPLLILDESHKAAGEASNTGRMITDLVKIVRSLGGDVAYGSGTPLKSVRNVKVYAAVLPDVGMPDEELIKLIEREPMALQEALSHEMVRGGTMISREMDHSDVVREFPYLKDINGPKMDRITEALNKFSGYLSEMMLMSGEISVWGQNKRKELLKSGKAAGCGKQQLSAIQVSTISPAGRFHMISNYLMFGMNAQFASELVAESTAKGFKPIIAVDSTGDSVVEHCLAGMEASAEEQARTLSHMPDMGDVLIRTADRMLDATIVDGFGVVERRRLTNYEDWLSRFIQRVEATDFSMFPTSAIDVMKDRLSKDGYRVGEMTGRKYELLPNDDGSIEVRNREKISPQAVKDQFNDGDFDVLIINRSASTGISLHASPQHGGDLRPRQMIKLQLQPDITDERQIDGRIHRTGQLFPGHYVMPMAGIAAQDRLIQMFNLKNRSLTATSAASRENASNIEDVTDLLNPVGEVVVSNFLEDNPEIALSLALDPDTARGGNLARRLIGRLIALPIDMQSMVMAELDTSFEMMVAALDAKGENPLRLRQHEWGAEVNVISTLVNGDAQSDAAARQPLTLNEITYTEQVIPQRLNDVVSHIGHGEASLVTDGVVLQIDEQFPEFREFVQTDEPDFASPAFDRILARSRDLQSLGAEEVPTSVALEIWNKRDEIDRSKSKGFENSVLDGVDRFAFLAELSKSLKPGNIVFLNPEVITGLKDLRLYQWLEDNDSTATVPAVPAVVTRVKANAERLLNLGEWKVRFAIPGEGREFTMTLASSFQIMNEARKQDQGEDQVLDTDLSWLVTAHDEHGVFDALASGKIRSLGEDHRREIEAVRSNGELKGPGGHCGVLMDDASRNPALMRSLFEHVRGGDVQRKRLSLEGNLFEAVRIGSFGKLGEKAIYTDSTGEMRHALILKDKGQKTLDKLDTALARRSSFRPVNDDWVWSLVEFHSLMQISPLEVDRQVFANVLAKLSDGVGDHTNNNHKLWRHIEDNFEEVFGKIADAMSSAKGSSALFVGEDPFADAGEILANVTRWGEYGRGHNQLCVGPITDAPPIIAKAMSNDGFLMYPINENQFVAIAGVKSAVVQERGLNWTKNVLHNMLPGKFVGDVIEADSVDVIICAAKHADDHIGLRGAILAMVETVEAVAREWHSEFGMNLQHEAPLATTALVH